MQWESFSEAEKTQFWQDIKGITTRAEQEKMVVNSLSKTIIESRKAGEHGEYLPLSVYKARGWDIKIIEEQCKDWKPCRMFGKRYNVEVEYRDKSEEERYCREQIMKGISDNKKRSSFGLDPSFGLDQGCLEESTHQK